MDKHPTEIQRAEHDGSLNAKKVVNAGTYSYYQNTSLVSGYNFYGLTAPGSNPTTSTFRIFREDTFTSSILFADGNNAFTHAWSCSSLASIDYL